VKYLIKSHFKYYLGDKNIHCHVEALHAAPPGADLLTEKLVDEITSKTNCSAIIATTSRKIADANRPVDKSNKEVVLEYPKIITEIFNHLEIKKNGQLVKPYLHLSLHGMKDRPEIDINVGTGDGEFCQSHIKNWLVKKLIDNHLNVVVDKIFTGADSLNEIKAGLLHNIFAIELSHNVRFNHFPQIVDILSLIILEFNQTFS